MKHAFWKRTKKYKTYKKKSDQRATIEGGTACSSAIEEQISPPPTKKKRGKKGKLKKKWHRPCVITQNQASETRLQPTGKASQSPARAKIK